MPIKNACCENESPSNRVASTIARYSESIARSRARDAISFEGIPDLLGAGYASLGLDGVASVAGCASAVTGLVDVGAPLSAHNLTCPQSRKRRARTYSDDR